MQQSVACCNAVPYVVTGDKRRAARGPCCWRSNNVNRLHAPEALQLGHNHGESAELCRRPVLHWNVHDPRSREPVSITPALILLKVCEISVRIKVHLLR